MFFQPQFRHLNKAIWSPFLWWWTNIKSFNLDLAAMAVDVADFTHDQALFGNAPTASSADMIVSHIFCAIGRLSR